MPIRPEFAHFYRGPAWRETRERIRARAGDCCEQCSAPNHARVIRRGGYWWVEDLNIWRDPDGEPNPPPRGLRRRIVYVVCTVAHLNHTPGDDRDENLKFLCASCHLRHDRELHINNARQTRQSRKDAGRPLLQEVL